MIKFELFPFAPLLPSLIEKVGIETGGIYIMNNPHWIFFPTQFSEKKKNFFHHFENSCHFNLRLHIYKYYKPIMRGNLKPLTKNKTWMIV